METKNIEACIQITRDVRFGTDSRIYAAQAASELAALVRSRDWYKTRVDLLQKAQSSMRDPERTMVCDIIANGHLLPDNGKRYRAESAEAEVARLRADLSLARLESKTAQECTKENIRQRQAYADENARLRAEVERMRPVVLLTMEFANRSTAQGMGRKDTLDVLKQKVYEYEAQAGKDTKP